MIDYSLNKKILLVGFLFAIFIFNNKISAQYISMTFHNGSMKSIPLQIPGVMNTNIIPKSERGVTLKVGQKVYLIPEGNYGKKELLFTVNSTFKKDTVLQIDELIKTRKKELKLEK